MLLLDFTDWTNDLYFLFNINWALGILLIFTTHNGLKAQVLLICKSGSWLMLLSTSHSRFMIRISLWLSKALDSFITVRTLVYFICNSKKFLLGSIIWHKESITSCILFVNIFKFQPLYSMTKCLHSVYGTSPLGQCHCILYACILILVSFHTYQKGKGGGGIDHSKQKF